jgi:hopanoid biosynthesis associated protein HpnK
VFGSVLHLSPACWWTRAQLNHVAQKKLIITADDFGLDEAVNEAVVRASTSGVLTTASLMVGAPAAADAVRRCRDLPRLRVGLHLVLVDGCSSLPRAQIPDLVNQDKHFRNQMVKDGIRYFAIRAVRRQLAAEIRAQFEAFRRTGLRLDHVNAHKHFHLHPSLLNLVLEIGCEFGMRAVRVPNEPEWFAKHCHPATGWLGPRLLSPWISIMKRRLHARGVAFNDRIFGIACSGRLYESLLLEILARLEPGVTEIYMHPATSALTAAAPSMHSYRHEEELKALLSSRVSAALAASGAMCGGYQDFSPDGV